MYSWYSVLTEQPLPTHSEEEADMISVFVSDNLLAQLLVTNPMVNLIKVAE